VEDFFNLFNGNGNVVGGTNLLFVPKWNYLPLLLCRNGELLVLRNSVVLKRTDDCDLLLYRVWKIFSFI
jgi:hypothetical protein